MASVKTEAVQSPPLITKTEPDTEAADPALLGDGDDDDDAYEDTGELEIPKEMPKAWLTKVPRPLYENWSVVDDDEPVQLGVLRRFKTSGRYHLILQPSNKYNQRVPLEYRIRLSDSPSGNTYVFSEKDLPDYKTKAKTQKPALAPQHQPGVKKADRYRSWRRKTVPKQTALVASAADEASCFALENEESRRIMAQRMAEDQANKPGVEKLVGDARLFGAAVLPSQGKISRPLALRGDAGFDAFVKTNQPKPKTHEQKTARIPHNDLLDLIFDCFKEYKYWPMKALRDRINQPHDYLRQTVSEVADLVRSGPFYGLYTLKTDFQHKIPDQLQRDEAAPKKEEGDSDGAETPDDDIGDDEDDVEMEDVYPAT